MMTDHLPDTIHLYQSVPNRLGGGTFIGGHSHLDDQGLPELDLTIVDDAGERDIRHHEGDTFEFAGAVWRVEKASGPTTGGRPRIATISRIA